MTHACRAAPEVEDDVVAPYLGVAGEVILFSSLVVSGMPFLLLVGAAYFRTQQPIGKKCYH